VLQISGKWYISSRRAAKEHGYHADYIGQLVRTGKVKGQKVGRSWYVLADSLTNYLEKEGGETLKVVPKKKPAPQEKKAAKAPPRIEEEGEEEAEEETEVIETVETSEEPEAREARPPASFPVQVLPEPVSEPVEPKIAREVREHPLLTYLHDEEPMLPAVPPHPVVPRSESQADEAEGIRIPIHATVKRWGATMQARTAPNISTLSGVHRLGSVPPRNSRTSLPWVPLFFIGAGVFIVTLALSIAISSSITAS